MGLVIKVKQWNKTTVSSSERMCNWESERGSRKRVTGYTTTGLGPAHGQGSMVWPMHRFQSVPASGAWIEGKDGQVHTVRSLTNEVLLGCRKPLYARDKRSSANPGVLVEREKSERAKGQREERG